MYAGHEVSEMNRMGYYSGIVARVLMELLRRSHADLMYI
jgi:hypothetical protein